MLVGHFAVALLTKRSEPKVSLGTLAVAAMLPDLLWPIFLLAGLEHVVYRPGRGAAQYLDFAASSFDFSHSLLLDVVWAVLLAGLYLLLHRYRRVAQPPGSPDHAGFAWAGVEVPSAVLVPAVILFLLVLSHWLLDVVSDRSMPLAPGVHTRIGLGLWSSIPLTLLIEGGLWLAAIILYFRAARSHFQTAAPRRVRSFVFWTYGWCIVLTLVWYNNIAGPPPPNPRAVPIVTLILFSIFIAWAYWIDRMQRASMDAAASSEGAQIR